MYPILRSLRDCFKSGQIAGKVGICLLLASFGTLIAGNAEAQVAGPVYCNKIAQFSGAATGLQQIVAAVNNQAIYICGFTVVGQAAGTTQIEYGTAINCGTGTAALTPAYTVSTATVIADSADVYRGMLAPQGNALCVNNSVASDAFWIVYYAQQ